MNKEIILASKSVVRKQILEKNKITIKICVFLNFQTTTNQNNNLNMCISDFPNPKKQNLIF